MPSSQASSASRVPSPQAGSGEPPEPVPPGMVRHAAILDQFNLSDRDRVLASELCGEMVRALKRRAIPLGSAEQPRKVLAAASALLVVHVDVALSDGADGDGGG